MTTQKNQAERLLASRIDEIARETPERAWVSMPQDDNDLSKGFLDVTFKQFSNAINHAAHWLDLVLSSPTSDFEGFAYIGPPDARVAIIAVAAVKSGRKILLPFTLAPDAVKGYLLDQTKCSAFVFAQTSQTSVENILATRPSIRRAAAPQLHEWITEKEAMPYKYNKTWEEGKDDPWIIFHTSGTTGLPKPITLTNKMMTVFDVASTLPDPDQIAQANLFKNRRVYSPIPMFHQVGMVGALQGTVRLGATIVLGPSTKLPSPKLSAQVLQFGQVKGFVGPPLLLKALSQDPVSLELVRSLDFINWGGAPLEKTIGDLLKDYVRMSPAFGTTEAGPYLTLLCEDPDDWQYYRFRDGQGIIFEPQANNLFELVFERKADALWQQIFMVYPELQKYHTKDLFRKHPKKDGLWIYSGRIDDVFILAGGSIVQASVLEELIAKHPLVHTALVGGNGRERPFLLVELNRSNSAASEDSDTTVSTFWPAVEAANETCYDYVKILKELVIVADPSKPFSRSGKETVLRRETTELYKEEINAAYESLGLA